MILTFLGRSRTYCVSVSLIILFLLFMVSWCRQKYFTWNVLLCNWQTFETVICTVTHFGWSLPLRICWMKCQALVVKQKIKNKKKTLEFLNLGMHLEIWNKYFSEGLILEIQLLFAVLIGSASCIMNKRLQMYPVSINNFRIWGVLKVGINLACCNEHVQCRLNRKKKYWDLNLDPVLTFTISALRYILDEKQSKKIICNLNGNIF